MVVTEQFLLNDYYIIHLENIKFEMWSMHLPCFPIMMQHILTLSQCIIWVQPHHKYKDDSLVDSNLVTLQSDGMR